MNVMLIWDADYPWDIRVEKFCSTMIASGMEVHIVCRNKAGKVREEVWQGTHIHRISTVPEAFGALNSIYGFPVFFSPVWLKTIWSVAKSRRIDLIIVRDLPMALAGVAAGKALGIPVVLDMAECYPELVKLIWKFERFKPSNILVRNPFVVSMIEKIAVRWIDHIFVMIEESRDRLLNKGVSPDKITIVSNTPVAERFQMAKPTFPGSLAQHKGKLILLYVGLLNFSRGVETVLEALEKVIQEYKNVFFAVLGTGNAEQDLKKAVQTYGMGDYVGFEGWVSNATVPEYVASADICIVPHRKCSHWDHTIPNKLFDYMASSKPVLVSDVAPMKRIVENTECGLVYEDGNIDDFVSQFAKLMDPELRSQLGRNGALAVQNHYNWRNDSRLLLQALDGLVRQ